MELPFHAKHPRRKGAELIRQLTTAAVNLLRLFLNRLNLHNLLFLKLGIEVSITLCRI